MALTQQDLEAAYALSVVLRFSAIGLGETPVGRVAALTARLLVESAETRHLAPALQSLLKESEGGPVADSAHRAMRSV